MFNLMNGFSECSSRNGWFGETVFADEGGNTV